MQRRISKDVVYGSIEFCILRLEPLTHQKKTEARGKEKKRLETCGVGRVMYALKLGTMPEYASFWGWRGWSPLEKALG